MFRRYHNWRRFHRGNMENLNGQTKKEKWRYFYEEFSRDFQDLSHELERRKYNKRLIMATGVGILGYATYGFFRNWASREVVQISSKTFDDEQFRQNAIKFAKDSIKELTESPETQQYVTTLLETSVINLVKQENIRNELSKLLSDTIASTRVKDTTKQSVSEVIDDLVNSDKHEEFRKNISKYLSNELQKQLSDKQNQNSFSLFAKNVLWRMFWKNKS